MLRAHIILVTEEVDRALVIAGALDSILEYVEDEDGNIVYGYKSDVPDIKNEMKAVLVVARRLGDSQARVSDAVNKLQDALNDLDKQLPNKEVKRRKLSEGNISKQ